jgi:hypothetical protein
LEKITKSRNFANESKKGKRKRNNNNNNNKENKEEEPWLKQVWIHDHLINVGFMMETCEHLLQKDMTIMQ